MKRRKFNRQYRKMHKKLIKLARGFRYYNYEYALDIFMQALNIMLFAWENPKFTLIQSTGYSAIDYHENLDEMKKLKAYYDKYKYGNTYEERYNSWCNMWKLIQEHLSSWWD